jgi:integrase
MNVMVVNRAKGSFVDPRAGRITLADWIAMWWPSYEVALKPSTQRTEWARVRTHLLPLLGGHRLDELDSLVMARFVQQLVAGERDPDRVGKWRRRPCAPKTVRNIHGVLHKILGAAADARLLPANPATGTGMPPRRHKEMRFLTPPDIERLLVACSDDLAEWRPLVMLLATTGLRYSEALALRVGRVDVLAGTITVLESAYNKGAGEYVFTEPKTPQSRRTVRITQQLALELTPLVSSRPRTALLFTAGDDLAPVTRNFAGRVWPRVLARAGLEGLRLHDLRHTVAALLISAGVPLTAVQRMLGHSSIKVTSDMYGHLMPEVHEAIVATMSGVLAPMPGTEKPAGVALTGGL